MLYNGIKTIHVPVDKIWKPDIILSIKWPKYFNNY